MVANRSNSDKRDWEACVGRLMPLLDGGAPPERRIARSTAGKDRHSKVRTAKGLRDRRVRLSAHTAIRFYDVQDRLGFDRPSKAVDWLIRKAEEAIAKLPPAFLAYRPPEAAGSQDGTLQLGVEAPTSMESFFQGSEATTITMAMPPSFHGYPIYQEDLCLSLQSPRVPIVMTATANNEAVVVNEAASSGWMASWGGERSSTDAVLAGRSSYRPISSTEGWIGEGDQILISHFGGGAGGFSGCFCMGDEHQHLSSK